MIKYVRVQRRNHYSICWPHTKAFLTQVVSSCDLSDPHRFSYHEPKGEVRPNSASCVTLPLSQWQSGVSGLLSP